MKLSDLVCVRVNHRGKNRLLRRFGSFKRATLAIASKQKRPYLSSLFEFHIARYVYLSRHVLYRNLVSKSTYLLRAASRYKWPTLLPINLKSVAYMRDVHMVADSGILSAFRSLVCHGLPVNKVCSELFKETFLHVVVSSLYDNLEKCRVLLSAGADINAMNCYGETPLHTAITVDRRDVCEYLLKHGASPDIKSRQGNVPREIEFIAKILERI